MTLISQTGKKVFYLKPIGWKGQKGYNNNKMRGTVRREKEETDAVAEFVDLPLATKGFLVWGKGENVKEAT